MGVTSKPSCAAQAAAVGDPGGGEGGRRGDLGDE